MTDLPPLTALPLGHRYADNGGVRLHYAACGEAGPPLVMIHGFPDFWFTWRYQMPALAKHYRLAAMDLRGYNLSDKPAATADYEMAKLVGDVAAVIGAHGGGRSVVVGHDWGGAIAWALATLRPELVSALIVLNLPHPLCLLRELAANPAQQAASAYARGFQQEGAEQALRQDEMLAWISDAGARAAYQEALGRSDVTAMLNYYRCNYPRPPYRESPWPRAKVPVPVLMIHGLEDPFLLPAALNGTWEWVSKDFTLITVPGAGHWVHHDAADLVTRSIEGWLTARAITA